MHEEAEQIRKFVAEIRRVCPEAVDGLATTGPPPDGMTPGRAVAVLRTLPDRAGAEAFLEACYDAASKGWPLGG